MKKLVAGAMAAGIFGSAGGLGTGPATADETVYAVGGAKVPGVPWYEYTQRTGRGYYPDAQRVIVDYPAGTMAPGGGPAGASVGESVVIGTHNLDAAIRNGSGSSVAIGLSEGALVLDAERARLAHDPSAPPPDQLSFTVFGDPAGSNAFGKSLMAQIFPPGTFVPIIDYTMPQPVESQYDTTVVVGAYDGIADFPDRPNLISAANSLIGGTFVHTPVAFTNRADVPAQNIRTTTNSRGGTTTTYLVPSKYLPMTMPLRYMGVPDATVDPIDAALRPEVDAGYSRNDDPSTAPLSIDPVSGLDARTVVDLTAGLNPLDGLDSTTRANIDGAVQMVRGLLPPGIG
jgi:hypothetical protein